MKKKLFIIQLAPVIFFAAISLFLVNSWFSEGKMLAKAEEGLPFYNPTRTFNLNNSFWLDNGVGNPNPFGKTRLLYYQVISFFQDAGFTSYFIQKLTFFFISLTSLLGAYYLGNVVFSGEKHQKPAAFFTALFYFFNLFVAVNVLYRFLYSFLFAMPLVVLSIATFWHGISRKSYIFSLLVAILSFVFSLAYSSPAIILTIWIGIGLVFLSALAYKRHSRQYLFFILSYFVLTMFLWIVVNYNWIRPLKDLSTTSFGQTQSGNLKTLISLSKKYDLINILRLFQKGFWENIFWASRYKSILYQTLSAIPIFVGAVVLFRKRHKSQVKTIAFILVVSIFIAKGSSPPLGNLFVILFKTFPPLQLFRNPFEKIGLLIIVGYALFWGFASIEFMKKQKLMIWIFLNIFVVGIMVLPIWNGAVFDTHGKSIALAVPDYYEELNKYVIERNGSARAIQFPSIKSDGTILLWEEEYRGSEPSKFLYDFPVVSGNNSFGQYSEVYQEFLKSLPYNQFWKLARVFGARYVIVNNDIDAVKLKVPGTKYFLDIFAGIKLPGGNTDQICVNEFILEKFEEEKYYYKCNVVNVDISEKYYMTIDIEGSWKGIVSTVIRDMSNNLTEWETYVDSANKIDVKLFQGKSRAFVLDRKRLKEIVVRTTKPVKLNQIVLDSGTKLDQEHLALNGNFGNISLYVFDESIIPQRIYAAKQIKLVNSIPDMYTQYLEESESESSVFLIDEEKALNFIKETMDIPEINFKKVRPDLYKINIINARNPFLLVFLEAYNSNWRLSLESEDYEHLTANGFANAYLIKKTGNYYIDLQFK